MKCLKFLSSLLVLSACLSGCFSFDYMVTNVEPEPSATVSMESGDIKTFRVEFIASGAGFCQWIVRPSYPSDVILFQDWSIAHTGNVFNFYPNSEKICNKMNLTSELKSFNTHTCSWYYCEWDPHFSTHENWEWEITLTQEPPIWHGDYFIENNIDMEGLNGFTEVTGGLVIGEADTLIDLDPLVSLTSVGWLSVYNNDSLTNLTGLDNITSPIDNVHIENNNSLTTLSALSNITSVTKGLSIENNDSLTTLTGLENITSNTSWLWYLHIHDNDSLTNLSPLSKIKSVQGSLHIGENDSLTTLTGLDNITSSIEYLTISGNDSLTNLSALSNITSVGYLGIGGNDSLTSLAGLDNVV